MVRGGWDVLVHGQAWPRAIRARVMPIIHIPVLRHALRLLKEALRGGGAGPTRTRRSLRDKGMHGCHLLPYRSRTKAAAARHHSSSANCNVPEIMMYVQPSPVLCISGGCINCGRGALAVASGRRWTHTTRHTTQHNQPVSVTELGRSAARGRDCPTDSRKDE